MARQGEQYVTLPACPINPRALILPVREQTATNSISVAFFGALAQPHIQFDPNSKRTTIMSTLARPTKKK